MDYPVDLELDAPEKIANWRPLVHWLLGLPHLFVASVLGNLGGVIGVISWFAIVFTGRLPEGLAGLQCMILRYQARAYSYVFWLRESYPAFEFPMTAADPGGDPIRVDIRPQFEDRNRLTVCLRVIWVIPALLFMMVISLVAAVVVFLSFFAVLFTGRWPEGMRRFVVSAARLSLRVEAYFMLLVDEYPPLSVQ